MPVYLQDPDENLDHTFNWASRLGSSTVSTSSWAVTPTATLTNQTHTTTTATASISGLLPGQVYHLVNTITTGAGTTEIDSVRIRGEYR